MLEEHEGKKRYAEADKLHSEGKYAEALKAYDELLAQNPSHPGLITSVATLLGRDDNTVGLAICLYEVALKHLKQVPASFYSNLGIAYKYAGVREKAMHYLEKSISVEPNAPALNAIGSMYVETGDPTKALDYLSKAIKINPEQSMAHWNIAIALLEAGQWDRAWDEYEYGMEPGGMRPERKIKDRPQWDGKSPGTIAVYGEQGIGDEIMFASMIPELMKTNEVIFDCHPRLKTLFEHSFGIKCYGTRKDPEIPWTANEHIDWQIAIGSLGKYFRRSRDAFPGTPYLKADPLPKGDKFRVGISWTGGRSSARIASRTVPLMWWESILRNDCEFVSLQYTNSDDEIDSVEARGFKIAKPPEAKAQDYYETARLVASCDLVISVCTSIVHLAGALGVPCWVMTPNKPAWRYGLQGGMVWYRAVRLYRQPEGDSHAWIPVVRRIGLDLEDKLSGKLVRAA